MYCLTKLSFFYIPLLYYVNLNPSIICCLSSGDIYISFGVSLLVSFCEAFVVLAASLLPIKSTVASAFF